MILMIQNIFSIYDKNWDKINFVNFTYYETCTGSYTSIHILDSYQKYIEYNTRVKNIMNDQPEGKIENDYIPTYFEPLMELVNNIIRLI